MRFYEIIMDAKDVFNRDHMAIELNEYECNTGYLASIARYDEQHVLVQLLNQQTNENDYKVLANEDFLNLTITKSDKLYRGLVKNLC